MYFPGIGSLALPPRGFRGDSRYEKKNILKAFRMLSAKIEIYIGITNEHI